MRLPLLQLRRILCEADVGTKELVDEIINALNEAYKDDDDGSDMTPFKCDVTEDGDGYIIDAYDNYDRQLDKDKAKLRDVVKNTFWLYAGVEPFVSTPNSKSVSQMVTGEYHVVLDTVDWPSFVSIHVRPNSLLKQSVRTNESVLHEANVDFPETGEQLELIMELFAYFQNEFGEENVTKTQHCGVGEFHVVYSPSSHDDDTDEEIHNAWEGFLDDLESALWVTTGKKPHAKRRESYAEITFDRFVVRVSRARSWGPGQIQRYAIVEVKHYPEVSRNMTEATKNDAFSNMKETWDEFVIQLGETFGQENVKPGNLKHQDRCQLNTEMPAPELGTVLKGLMHVITGDRPKVIAPSGYKKFPYHGATWKVRCSHVELSFYGINDVSVKMPTKAYSLVMFPWFKEINRVNR